MPEEYWTQLGVSLPLLLAYTIALLYRAYARRHCTREPGIKEVDDTEAGEECMSYGALRSRLSVLIWDIDGWQCEHQHFPLDHPDIQPTVNRAFGLADYLLQMNHMAQHDGHLMRWHAKLLPFVGVEQKQKEDTG